MKFTRTTGGTALSATTSPIAQVGERVLIGASMGGGSGDVKVQGAISDFSASASYTGSITTLTGSMFVGKRDNNTLYFNGWLYEIVIYSRLLSGAERSQIENYLRSKWP